MALASSRIVVSQLVPMLKMSPTASGVSPAEMVARIAGYKGNIEWDASKPDGTMQKLLDSSLFYSLGWKPRYEFLESLKNTYEWYLKNKNGGLS